MKLTLLSFLFFNLAKKLSKFAQERKKQSKTLEKEKNNTESGLTPSNIIIGNIVERKEGIGLDRSAVESVSIDDSVGFPKPKRIDKKVRNSLHKRYFLFSFHEIDFLQIKLESTENKSIFAQLHSKNDEPGTSSPMQPESKLDFGRRSHIIENADAPSIHNENTEYLQSLGEAQILEERNRLLGSLDPSLVQFLKEKRKAKLPKAKVAENRSCDVEMKEVKPQSELLPDIDLLKDENSKNWLHFDVIETDKLEWMRDLPKNMPDLKPGEQYEARFDWKGVLLPFKPKEEDSTVASTELYLHGDDSHRPGYTLQELFRLARSAVVQQRISALRSIGGILSIYNQGYYDGIFELPISKVFFLLRYAFDDNTPAMLEESAKALSALFYNETDEVLLPVPYSLKNIFFKDNSNQN